MEAQNALPLPPPGPGSSTVQVCAATAATAPMRLANELCQRKHTVLDNHLSTRYKLCAETYALAQRWHSSAGGGRLTHAIKAEAMPMPLDIVLCVG